MDKSLIEFKFFISDFRIRFAKNLSKASASFTTFVQNPNLRS